MSGFSGSFLIDVQRRVPNSCRDDPLQLDSTPSQSTPRICEPAHFLPPLLGLKNVW